MPGRGTGILSLASLCPSSLLGVGLFQSLPGEPLCLLGGLKSS